MSNTITGKVADTRINSAYYKELENAPIIDEDYHNFIHKQPIVLSLADNKLVITSEPVNINKGDRYSTYIELLGAPEQLEEYFLIGCVNDQYCFYKFTNGANVDFIENLDTSSVTNMYQMFYNCPNLTTIPLLDTSSVIDMSAMFKSCYKLNSIPQLNTSNVIYMDRMFYDCRQLISIPQLDTSNVISMNNIFYDC